MQDRPVGGIEAIREIIRAMNLGEGRKGDQLMPISDKFNIRLRRDEAERIEDAIRRKNARKDGPPVTRSGLARWLLVQWADAENRQRRGTK